MKANRNTHYSVLTARLCGRPIFSFGHDPLSWDAAVAIRYSGIALKRIRSEICDIRKGQSIIGIELDDDTWFIMPSQEVNGEMKAYELYPGEAGLCVMGVPSSSVSMKPIDTGPSVEKEFRTIFGHRQKSMEKARAKTRKRKGSCVTEQLHAMGCD